MPQRQNERASFPFRASAKISYLLLHSSLQLRNAVSELMRKNGEMDVALPPVAEAERNAPVLTGCAAEKIQLSPQTCELFCASLDPFCCAKKRRALQRAATLSLSKNMFFDRLKPASVRCWLFCCTIGIPEERPKTFQSSHARSAAAGNCRFCASNRIKQQLRD